VNKHCKNIIISNWKVKLKDSLSFVVLLQLWNTKWNRLNLFI
jgi:hypothetical protein